MTSDDQHFLDHLDRASASIRAFAADLSAHASTAEATLSDALSDAVRSLNSSFGWALPVPTRRAALGASGAGFAGGGAGRAPPKGVIEAAWRWVDRHRGVVVALAAFATTGAVGLGVMRWVADREGRRRSRRARRARNGARKEVIVIAGTPGSRLVTMLARDLEKRGFVVYVVATSREEFLSVQAEGKPDIRPLAMDLIDLPRTDEAIEQFGRALQTPIQSSPMSSRHHLEFTGLVIAPDLIYPSGSALDLEPAIWQETFNAKVLSNVSATRAFLPLIIQHHSRILYVTPNIIQSLKPAYNAVESSLGCALEAYITSLQREMSEYDVHVSHIKLGAVDLTSPPASGASSPGGLVRAHAAVSSKELQYAVFDALTMTRPFRVRRVGRGSLTYDIAGKLMPGSLVQWMMQGLKAKSTEAVPADEWSDVDQSSRELMRSIHD